MKNEKKIDWLTTVVLGVAFSLVFIILIAAYSQPFNCAVGPGNGQEHAQCDKKGFTAFFMPLGDWIERHHSDIEAASTFIVAVFTFVLARFTINLASATDSLVRGAEDTAERQLRAYIIVNEGYFTDIEVGKIPSARVTLQNFGQTPAYNTTQWAVMRFGRFPSIEAVPGDEPENMGRFPFGPGGRHFANAKLSAPLTEMDLVALRAEKAAIYITGQVRYTDAFGKPRTTDYCMFAGGPIGIDGSMAPYHDGNQID